METVASAACAGPAAKAAGARAREATAAMRRDFMMVPFEGRGVLECDDVALGGAGEPWPAQRSLGRRTRTMPCAIWRLPLLRSSARGLTSGSRSLRSLWTRRIKASRRESTSTLTVAPGRAVARLAPSERRAAEDVMADPGTTW